MDPSSASSSVCHRCRDLSRRPQRTTRIHNRSAGQSFLPHELQPKVQAQFERAVAMLHSFWYSAGERAFKDVSRRPALRDRVLGIAAIQMSNPLAGQGASPKGAEVAQAAIDRGAPHRPQDRPRARLRRCGRRVLPGFQHAVRARTTGRRAQAYEALAEKYPSDDEAQIFAALYIAGTQTQSDQTYAAYLKAAAVLEEQFKKHPDHPVSRTT
jgi:hypothetical protein